MYLFIGNTWHRLILPGYKSKEVKPKELKENFKQR